VCDSGLNCLNCVDGEFSHVLKGSAFARDLFYEIGIVLYLELADTRRVNETLLPLFGVSIGGVFDLWLPIR
jgi:hypothetical protein